MAGSQTNRPEVTPSNALNGAPAKGLVPINGALLRDLMAPDKLNISSPELARATGKSPGYIRQVRTGRRTRVPRSFVRAAEIYVGERIGWRDVPAGVLLGDRD